MVDVLVVAVKGGDEVVAREITPTDGALPIKGRLAVVEPTTGSLLLGLLSFELGLIQA